jgi:hypothetical protein
MLPQVLMALDVGRMGRWVGFFLGLRGSHKFGMPGVCWTEYALHFFLLLNQDYITGYLSTPLTFACTLLILLQAKGRGSTGRTLWARQAGPHER